MITRTMTIEAILTDFPEKSQHLIQAMTRAGLHCATCDSATWETLEAGMQSHEMGEEVDQLVTELNEILKKAPPQKNTITLTKRAADKYQTILEGEGKKGWGLSFSLKSGGCKGFEYLLDYAETAKEREQTFVSEGVSIYVPESSVERLLGSEIDYTDGLQGSGFKITNPNVASSCGCGNSHGY